jgi:hypothetical protein
MDPTDKDIFAAALAPEPETAPQPEPAPVANEPLRDESGRFAPKADEPALEAQQQPTPQPEVNTGNVPSFRLKEEAEARRKAEERAQALEQQMFAIQRQMLEAQKPKEPPQPAPSVWEDEGKWGEHLVQPVQQNLRQVQEHFSLKMAVKEHGQEKVSEAYQSMGDALKVRDPQAEAAYRRAMASLDPYEEIMGWHKQTSVLREVGTDPNAWLERKLEERMNDPAFLAKYLERAKGVATQQPGGQVVQLPPSLSSARGAAGSPAQSGDMSDASLFAAATRR